MSTEHSDLRSVLSETARILARGGALEDRLDGIAHQTARATGATGVIVYLLDADAGSLVPAGGSGRAGDRLAAVAVSLDDPGDPVVRAALDRSIGTSPAAPTTVHVPLLADEVAGAAEVHGVLVAGFDRAAGEVAELEDLLGAMADLAAVVIRDARLEQALLERADWLDRMANTDPLTGLANRRTFDRMLELELARAGRQATPLCILLLDVDDLAGISEREGRKAADDVLRWVASTLSEQVRLVDTVARAGSDGFAVIAPGSGGDTVARRIRDAVGRLRTAGGHAVAVTVGVSRFPDQGRVPEELLAGAEQALASARQGAGVAVAWAGQDPA